MSFRPTHAVIDLKSLQHNYQEVVKRLPKQCGILAMVKADAYGHGAVGVAGALEKNRVTSFGVATVEEGIELRQSGIQTQILVMGGVLGGSLEAAQEMWKHHLTPVVHGLEGVDLVEKVGERAGSGIAVHLKIDTGMSRLGIIPQELPQVLERLKKSSHVKLEGVMTHLAWRQDPEYTARQIQVFKEAGEKIVAALGNISVWHIANSASILEGGPLESSLGSETWVRPGIMLYGIPPYPEFKTKAFLKPVLSLVSKIVLLKNLPVGTKISYNCTFATKRPSRVGVIPIGYADGYPWGLSNKGEVLVEGRRCPILGRVTMDMIMVDVTDLPAVSVGSEAVLLGRQKEEEITADELAAKAGTFAYEIVCRISKRMPRIYRE